MRTIREVAVAPGTGWRGEIDAGQVLCIAAQSVVDFVAYNRADPSEWFDAARTRVYNLNLFPTRGHRLFSKHNNPMMRLREDGFAGTGRHDLQFGQGCPAAMAALLAPLGIAPEDVPDPLGLFRHLEIDQASGAITPAPRAPDAPAAVELAAEIDLVVALVNCPEPATSAPGAPAAVTVLAP